MKKKSAELQTPGKSTPLYQQLYVPTLGGPNPNLLNLDKIIKRYSKVSKYLLSLNLCIGFFLAISFGVKVYYISEYYVHLCKVFEYFSIITLIGNIIWLISSFMVVFGMKKKSILIIKIYLIMMVFCFIIMVSSGLYWKFKSEKCEYKTNMMISLISNGIETVGIFILFWAQFYLLKLLKHIHILRDSYMTDQITDLK